MTRFLTLLATLLALALPAKAEEIVAGLSQNAVQITATFVGSEILIFGAVKRDTPAPEGDLGVAVVIEGPSHPITVRRKEKRMGIWVNTDAVEVNAAPSFYAVSTSAPFNEIISEEVDRARHISIPESIRIFHSEDVADPDNFAEAVIRIRENDGLYTMEEGGVRVTDNTLFDTHIELPANLTEGNYRARIYLTRGGDIVSNYVTNIDVHKVGIERWLYNLAHEQALLYGLMSLAIAVAAGWGASTFFRVFFRS
ncbi:TIGR02186 family protein [Sinisalibacter aestuarii]|uniref:Membrane protein n=1 Tax=Sinisalibacter aestuarii TaxID=2949426 RepID=A0ABQ5LZ48_9RHOB|nr:TIGR02186 family protein [Sinisalibacter aestuarii]GKY89377.1 membrane protein [Sinisalibacter aestuarii]